MVYLQYDHDADDDVDLVCHEDIAVIGEYIKQLGITNYIITDMETFLGIYLPDDFTPLVLKNGVPTQ